MNPQGYFEVILLACWIVFVGYWIYSAPKAKRTVGSSFFGAGIAWRLLIVIAVVAIAKVQPHILLQTFVTSSLWWGVLSCALAIAGVCIAIWARYYLGCNWGMPMTVKENAELVTSGPYKWIRNPIYTGVMLILIGSGLVAGVWWLIICLGTVAYFILSVFQEEKIMLKAFPNTYPAYKARTWRLVPFIF
ncbi:MAG TPA: isoprenylcysteine carboxylmethyltransferase family protein [Candidatus Paceibacterota bacterium]|nr:isoprenylcysteine carboxylmethyltransferase family protein [Candidatus Paceibacterota bacterium]